MTDKSNPHQFLGNRFFVKPDIGVHTECAWREKVTQLETWMSMTREEMINRLHSGDMSLETLLREADECGLFEWEKVPTTEQEGV